MSTAYKPRPTYCTGVSEVSRWQVKRYEILSDAQPLPDEARPVIDAVIAEIVAAEEPDELAIGFAIVHQGLEGVWLLVDLWRGDVICQHTFRADRGDDLALTRVEAGGPTMCIWEMEVQAHERAALIRHILDPDQPDVDAYLADQLDNRNVVANREVIEQFAQAWDAGAVDDLMALMADDPVYRASTGDEPGRTYQGTTDVRAGFAAVIEAEAATGEPPPPSGDLHVFEDRALSFWSYLSADPNGQTVQVEGVDVWRFDHGRIALKDAYRKSFGRIDPSG